MVALFLLLPVLLVPASCEKRRGGSNMRGQEGASEGRATSTARSAGRAREGGDVHACLCPYTTDLFFQ